MRTVYNLLAYIAYGFIQVAQLFSKKLKLFVKGRKQTFQILEAKIKPGEPTIWFHCASLGEFEQGVPIIEAVKKDFPYYKIVITFFSPSGYEIKKNTSLADAVVYLPFDTKHNAKRFIATLQPSLVLFIKYEFWANYLLELQVHHIPTLLISGLFREKQLFFKPYGQFMRKVLKTIDHFFVQDNASKVLLESIGQKNITVSGDTRFDRVSHQIEQDNSLDFIEEFKGDSLCVVCGSTWPEDENMLLPYINTAPENVKFIIAPHKIESTKIERFRKRLNKSSVLYSEMEREELFSHQVFVIDTIGYLTKIYSYANIAYVGGAIGATGLHNILEPATFGLPIVIGCNFDEFPEAKRLQQLAGLFSISNSQELISILEKLIGNRKFRQTTGMISGHYVNSNTGATRIVMEYLRKKLTHK